MITIDDTNGTVPPPPPTESKNDDDSQNYDRIQPNYETENVVSTTDSDPAKETTKKEKNLTTAIETGMPEKKIGVEAPVNNKSVGSRESPSDTQEASGTSNILWVCSSCQEQHDEPHLSFCGMCGEKRHKITTPKPSKTARMTSSGKRSRTVTQANIGGRSPGPAGDKNDKRPSSAGGLRRVRSKDGNRTPRSRSKSKVDSKLSENIPLADMMVVKCLDGGEEKALDINELNAKFNTFAATEGTDLSIPPARPKKKTLRRSQSDVTQESSPMVTPRVRRKGAPRSSTFHATAPPTPRKVGHLPNPKHRPAVRQAIPRRSKSSTTAYLNQLKKEAAGGLDNNSGHSGKPTLQTRSLRLRPELHQGTFPWCFCVSDSDCCQSVQIIDAQDTVAP